MEILVGISEAIRNFVLAGAAGVGAWVAFERVPREKKKSDTELAQADLVRRDMAWELFNRSITQLGDTKLEVRLGAIYCLESIAQDFDEVSQPVIDVLTAYIRSKTNKYGDKEPPVDIQLIMRIIRDESHG